MKIQFASDLHLEFPENSAFLRANPIRPVGDILLLAGDIAQYYTLERQKEFFRFCSSHFQKTFWVPGNHEYYHSEIGNRTGHFEEEILPNVFLVNNHVVTVENLQIICSTLWTPVSDVNAVAIQKFMYDYRLIKDGDHLFSPARSTQLYEENLNFLKGAVSACNQKKCMVVTHHVPTPDHYPEEYRGSVLNEAFVVALNVFINSSKIDYWIYGHHHRNIPPFRIGNTNLLTNQLGYVKKEEHSGFKTDYTIDISKDSL